MTRRLLPIAVAVELAVLVASGIALFFVYQPAGTQAWAGSELVDERVSTAVRTVHAVSSTLLLATVAVTVVAAVASAARRARAAVAGLALVVAAAGASFTGYLLAWDQLALWAVTTGANLNGFVPLLGDDVRFVLIDGTEVAPSTLVRWLVVHALVLTPLAIALVFVLRRQRTRVASDA